MTAPDPLVSVVIATRDRPQLLRRCLQALLAQELDARDYEILVVDDGREPGTCRVIRELSTLAPRLRYLAPGQRRGPAAARNCGWRRARGRVIAFTDDDTVADRHWLSAGLKAIDEGAAAVAGRIVVPLPPEPTDYERDVARLERAEFATANCFVRRSALAAVGGFDERFTTAWREDSDLHFRLLKARLPLRRADAAVVLHPPRPAPWGVSLSQQTKVMFDALLYAKHPLHYRQHIRASARWDYYGNVGLLVCGALAAGSGAPAAAALLLTGWAMLTARFCAQRLRGAARTPRHLAEMLLTSAAIPPLALFWRVAGWLRFGKVLL